MASARSVCEDVQLALVERGERESWVVDHVAACAECRFFEELSLELSGSDPSPPLPGGDSRLGRFEALLARAQATGTRLRRYRLGELLGRGGQGVVYRAVDTETGETVALKLVRCPPPHAGTTASEVTHAHLVRHLGVCRVYHTERHGEVRLIVMELIEGRRLDEAVAAAPVSRRLAVFRRVCEAVGAAHAAGVLHLDLKPSNVLVRPSGEPVVTDFGLSVRVSGGEQPARSRGGTFRFMAPEQRDGRPVDERTDVYALGMMLRELLPDAPRQIARVIERASAEAPRARYRDVASLVESLDRPERLRRGGVAAGLASFGLLAVGLLSWRGPALPSSDVLVLGGTGPDGHWSATAETFDASAWRWRTIEPVPDPGRARPRTCEMRAVRAGDEVLVLGGGAASGCADDGATTSRVRAYSLAARSWSVSECQPPCVEHEGATFVLDRSERDRRRRWRRGACTPQGPCMLFGRNSFVALAFGDDDVFVYGGCAGACGGPNELDQTEYRTQGWPVSVARTAEIYRRATRAWTPLLPSLRSRQNSSAAAIGGSVLVCGPGSLGDGADRDGTCELFDRNATRDAWRPAGRMPGAASPAVMVSVGAHVALGLQPGHAWLWGDKSMWGHSREWGWDGSFFEPLPLPARGQHSGTLTRLRDGRVLLAGGFESDRVVAAAQIFTLEPDRKGGAWKEVAPMRRARSHHGAVALRDGRILVAGGCDPEPLSSAEVYDPARDLWIDAGPMSNARCRPQAVAVW